MSVLRFLKADNLKPFAISLIYKCAVKLSIEKSLLSAETSMDTDFENQLVCNEIKSVYTDFIDWLIFSVHCFFFSVHCFFLQCTLISLTG